MRIWQDYRRVMASLLLLGLLAEPLPARAEEPSGTYQAQGVAPNGKSYAGIVEILPQGKGAHLAWQLEGGARYLGLGLRLDNVLGAVYWPLQVKSNGIGVVIYRIDGGRLNGDWMILQGPRDQVGEEELEGPPELEGRFEIVRGVNPGGASGYKGHVEISRRGDVYYFRWFTPTASAVGNGVRVGDIMVVGYGIGSAPGVVGYCVDNGSLDGLWAPPEIADPVKIRLGRETLHKDQGAGDGSVAIPSDCTAQTAAVD